MANTATRTLFAATLAAFAGLVLAPTQSRAEFPEKPVNLIVPLGAGGSHDLNARVIASNIPQYLGTLMGVSVITGEAGQTGTKALAAAPADGYTLLGSPTTTSICSSSMSQICPMIRRRPSCRWCG